MAKEFEGVVLLLALLLRCTKGRELLSDSTLRKVFWHRTKLV